MEKLMNVLQKYGVTGAVHEETGKKIIRADETLERCKICDGKSCISAQPGMKPEIKVGEGFTQVHYTPCEKKIKASAEKCALYAKKYGVESVDSFTAMQLETTEERLKICADCDGEICPWGGKAPSIKVKDGKVCVEVNSFGCAKNLAWSTDEEPGSAADLAKKAEYRARIEAVKAKYGLKKLTLTGANNILYIENRLKKCGECRLRGDGDYCITQFAEEKPEIVIKDGELEIKHTVCPRWLEFSVLSKMKTVGLPRKYWSKTYADYEETADNRKAIKWAREYAAKLPDKSIYFYGAPGTGKTYLVTLMAKEIITRGLSTKEARLPKMVFGDLSTLLDKIKETFDKPNLYASDVLDKYMYCGYLILDDLGTSKLNEWTVNMLYQIINGRYNEELPLIITSNYSFSELEKVLSRGDGDCARRIVSRLEEMCVTAYFGQKDRRRKNVR